MPLVRVSNGGSVSFGDLNYTGWGGYSSAEIGAEYIVILNQWNNSGVSLSGCQIIKVLGQYQISGASPVKVFHVKATSTSISQTASALFFIAKIEY